MWYPLPVSWWYKYEKVCLFYLILFPVLLRQCSGSLPHFASTAAPAAAPHLPAPLARPSTINLLSTSRLSLHFYLDALSLPHVRATLHLYKHPSTDTCSSKACNWDAEITAKHQPLWCYCFHTCYSLITQTEYGFCTSDSSPAMPQNSSNVRDWLDQSFGGILQTVPLVKISKRQTVIAHL